MDYEPPAFLLTRGVAMDFSFDIQTLYLAETGDIAFLIDFVVVCFIVPQTLQAPSTLTLGPLLARVCCLGD